MENLPVRSVPPMGQVENGKALPYDFSIGNLLSEAWQNVHGYKATLLGATAYFLLTVLLLAIVVGFVESVLLATSTIDKNLMQNLTGTVLTILTLPLLVGLLMLGVRRSVALPVKAKQVFSYYKSFWRILGVYVVEVIIFAIIMLLMVVCFSMVANGAPFAIGFKILNFVLAVTLVYLSVAYMFAMVIRVEKNLGIWQSLEASRKGVSQHWFKIFFAFILTNIIVMISAIPLFIGLIWTLPLMNLFLGTLYRTMFGVQEVR